MSEFEKELEKNIKLNKVAYEKENIYSDFLVSKRDIERVFHDWQTPKPLVVVPQFVADWFDINQDDIDGNIKDLTINICRNPKSGWSEMDEWFMYFPNKPIETLINMKLYGYTVKKEKTYYLCEKNTGYYLNKKGDSLKLVVNPYFDDNNEFTQDEIDKLNTGSYEQVEVEPRKTQKLS